MVKILIVLVVVAVAAAMVWRMAKPQEPRGPGTMNDREGGDSGG